MPSAGRAIGWTTAPSANFSRRWGSRSSVTRNEEGGSQNPDRDEQFRYIAAQRAAFLSAGLPVISIDTKQKELIGNFRN